MLTQQILSEMTTIFRDILDGPTLELRPETTAQDVPEWDSLAHVQLVTAVEKHFRVTFSAAEIRGFKNIGEMCASISSKRP